MPDYITHQVSGKVALQKLNNHPVTDILSRHEKSFQFGLMGADLLYYNPFPLFFGNKRILSLAKGLHAENSDNLGKHSMDFFDKNLLNANLERIFAYICGFMLHHTVDNHTHPIIKKKSKNLKMHKLIEMNLDIMIAKEKDIPVKMVCPKDLFSNKSICHNVMNLFKHMSHKMDVKKPSKNSLKQAYKIMKHMNIFILSSGKNFMKRQAQKLAPLFFHEHTESKFYMDFIEKHNIMKMVDDGIDSGVEHIVEFYNALYVCNLPLELNAV